MDTFPFWTSRKPELFDQLLFLPPAMEKIEIPLPEGPLHMELCSGNGSWIAEKARAEPHIFWIAVEKKFDRSKKIWLRAKRMELKNLLVVCGTAENFVNYVLPERTLSKVFVNFPDPWPKRRHIKHRLMKPEFITGLKRGMKENGVFTLVTDDYPYFEEASKALKGQMASLRYLTNPEDYGTSYFEELWRKEGRIIHYTEYANTP